MTNATVLLIDANTDDERLFREEFALVRDQPFALEVARTLAEGLALLKQRRFEVILLDLNLPDSLGLTTFLRLQPKAGLQPIIVLVGQADEDLGAEAVERGALDFLIKQQIVSTLLAKALRYATERTHTLLALKASETRYRELYENVVAGVFQTTPDGKFMAANPALVRLLGYDVRGRAARAEHRARIYMYTPRSARTGCATWRRPARSATPSWCSSARTAARSWCWRIRARCATSTAQVLYYEGTLTDITEAHELSRQLVVRSQPRRAVRPDQPPRVRAPPATRARLGAGHRHAVTRCAISISISSRSSTTPAATSRATSCCDSSRRSCRVACAATTRWRDSAATSSGCCCTTARIDGRDEQSRTDCSRPSSNISSSGAASTFTVGASIGLVPLSGSFRRITQVLQAADAACYAAKDQGRNRVHVYQEDDAVVAQRHGEMQWVARVKRALNENRFFLEAQPIVPIAGPRRQAPGARLRAAAAHARRVRQRRAARRIPAGRGALQPVAAPGSLGHHRQRCSGWPRIRATHASASRACSSICPATRSAIRSCRSSSARRSTRCRCRRRRSASKSPRPRRSAI